MIHKTIKREFTKMNIEALAPFMPQGVQPAQPFQPDRALDQVAPQEPLNSFESTLQKATQSDPLQINSGGVQLDAGNVTSNPFTAEQGFSAAQPFAPAQVEQVQQVANQPLGLEQLSTRAQGISMMRGVNGVSSLTRAINTEPEAIAISKEAAEFRRKKVSNAYTKLSRYAARSGMIYA